jgi:hypothetical protein
MVVVVLGGCASWSLISHVTRGWQADCVPRRFLSDEMRCSWFTTWSPTVRVLVSILPACCSPSALSRGRRTTGRPSQPAPGTSLADDRRFSWRWQRRAGHRRATGRVVWSSSQWRWPSSRRSRGAAVPSRSRAWRSSPRIGYIGRNALLWIRGDGFRSTPTPIAYAATAFAYLMTGFVGTALLAARRTSMNMGGR